MLRQNENVGSRFKEGFVVVVVMIGFAVGSEYQKAPR